MTKLYNLAYDPDTGEEDVRYVTSKMHLTYQEFDKLYEGAKKKFSE